MVESFDRETWEAHRWLTSAEGAGWLTELAASRDQGLRALTRLRRILPSVRANLLLEQVELRKRARDKFADSDRMFFTRTALEQATDQWIAAYKAQRFAGRQCVADLCCGIGGDLLGLAAHATATAVDRDRVALLLAEANVAAVCGDAAAAQARFVAMEVAQWRAEDFDAWHVDPDRRIGGRRTTQLEVSSPDLQEVMQRTSRNKQAAVKLAPAADVPASWRSDCELEWIGRGGECKQLVAWHGELAEAVGQRRATIIGRAHDATGPPYDVLGSIIGSPRGTIEIAAGPGRYVYEPDAAVLAARLQSALAERHQMRALSTDGFWLTSDVPLDDGCLACFEVLDVMPFDRRQLSRYLAQHSIGTLEIKTRGVDVAPERLRKELKPKGDRAATLIITSIGDVLRAIIARR